MLHIDVQELKKELESEAKELGLSLNAYCRMILKTYHKIVVKNMKNE